MADNYRVLEIVGAVFSIIFALLGANGLFKTDYNSNYTSTVLNRVANNMFLLAFGIAGAVLLGSPQGQHGLTPYFGFLTRWGGRMVYFLVMGFYVYPTVCYYSAYYGTYCSRSWANNSGCSCFEFNKNQDALTSFGVIAAAGSVVLGVIVAVLLCFNLSESCPGDLIGSRKNMDNVDIACAVASFGMVICGLNWLLGRNLNGPTVLVCQALALTFIMLSFGILSLIGALRNSSFVSSMLGLVCNGWPRGAFYLFMGFYMWSLFYNTSDDLFNTVCWICGIVSIVVGIVVIVLQCCR